jgi:hypothetical protein
MIPHRIGDVKINAVITMVAVAASSMMMARGRRHEHSAAAAAPIHWSSNNEARAVQRNPSCERSAKQYCRPSD